jgi:hypothetical protein
MENKSGREAQKTKISDEHFPYKKYEKTEAWRIVDTTISNLVANDDLKETTNRKYIVGYICRCLDDAGVLRI